uniref:Uncharacterized protein n=1 Tax=Arundo donax TaxID=35708 RepID=A0A0A8Z5Q2_ARUDO
MSSFLGLVSMMVILQYRTPCELPNFCLQREPGTYMAPFV